MDDRLDQRRAPRPARAGLALARLVLTTVLGAVLEDGTPWRPDPGQPLTPKPNGDMLVVMVPSLDLLPG